MLLSEFKNCEIIKSMSIKITKKAISYIRKLRVETKDVLKFGVKSGGCNGFEYNVEITPEKKLDKFDRIINQDGVKVAIDGLSFMYIKDLKIDYEKTILSSGFKFENPNATNSCGCNKSFNI